MLYLTLCASYNTRIHTVSQSHRSERESTEVGLPAFDEARKLKTAHLCCIEKVIDIGDVNHVGRSSPPRSLFPRVCARIRERTTRAEAPYCLAKPDLAGIVSPSEWTISGEDIKAQGREVTTTIDHPEEGSTRIFKFSTIPKVKASKHGRWYQKRRREEKEETQRNSLSIPAPLLALQDRKERSRISTNKRYVRMKSK